jgi:hypothetical protein
MDLKEIGYATVDQILTAQDKSILMTCLSLLLKTIRKDHV